MYSFTYTLARTVIHSPARTHTHSHTSTHSYTFTYSLSLSHTHTSTHMQSLIHSHSFIYLLARWHTHSHKNPRRTHPVLVIHSLARLLTHSPIRSHTHSLARSLAHSATVLRSLITTPISLCAPLSLDSWHFSLWKFVRLIGQSFHLFRKRKLAPTFYYFSYVLITAVFWGKVDIGMVHIDFCEAFIVVTAVASGPEHFNEHQMR
jgi:hypothetical protein